MALSDDVKDYLDDYAGSHFDELVDADYDIIVADTLEALGYDDDYIDIPTIEAWHAVSKLMFWARELTVVVGDKDDYARARQNYDDAREHANQYLSTSGVIKSIRLRSKHYHQGSYYDPEIDPLSDWNPVI
jgi:hypothetical protein